MGTGNFGVTDQGFRAKRLADVRASLYTRLRAITDPVTNQSMQLVDPDDPVVQITDIFAESLADCWLQLENVAALFDPDKATGAILSAQVQLNGLTRKPASRSLVRVTITGPEGASLPRGTPLTTSDNSRWQLADTGLIDFSGEITVNAEPENVGPIFIAADTITGVDAQIYIPPETPSEPDEPFDPGTLVEVTATNPAEQFRIGELIETDEALRRRRDISTEAPSQSPVEAISAALYEIAGVSDARVYINNTLSTDSRGIPSKTIAPFVIGGRESDIADALFNRSPAGAGFQGSIQKMISDPVGIDHSVFFSRPAMIDLRIDLRNEITSPPLYTDQGNALIMAQIQAWAAQAYRIGRDLNVLEMLDFVYTVPGHAVNSVQIMALDADGQITSRFSTSGLFDIQHNERPNAPVSANLVIARPDVALPRP